MRLENEREDAEVPGRAPAGISVRKARKSDFPVVEEMVGLVFPAIRFRPLEGDMFLLAERSGVAVGFCHLRMREKTAFIVGLGVLPQYRGHGIGSVLLSEALYRVDRRGIGATLLRVRALNAASNLYLAFGFFGRKSGDTLLLVRKRPS